jgi:hypothetical protein
MSSKRPDYLASGEPARLIPTLADTNKEQRTTSIFLAAMMAVPKFGKTVLDTINVRTGKTTKIEAYTEVTFPRQKTKSDFRPDGLLVVRTGKSEWRALFEAKSGNARLSRDQLQSYLDIAKEFNIDALITISNQLAVLPGHHPLLAQVRLPRNVNLFHWSWTYLLTEATLLVTADDFDDPEQRYIVSEVARYLKHPNSGVTRFDRMNSEWKELVSAVQNRVPLNQNSLIVQNSIASWHQEQRDVCLLMSRRVGQSVDLKVSRKHAANMDERFLSDCKRLVSDHALIFAIDVPNSASTITVTADVARRNIACSMTLNAPEDKKSTRARVNWLIRQLKDAPTKNIFVRGHWGGRTVPTQISLSDLMADPEGLNGPSTNKSVRAFEILMTKDLGADFGRTTKFITQLEDFVPQFYHDIGQNLRPWKPAPPKIRDSDENAAPHLTVEPEKEKPTFDAEREVGPSLSATASLTAGDESIELPAFLRRYN